MNLRKLRHRRPKQPLSDAARKLERDLTTEWVRQNHMVHRLEAPEAEIVETILELIDERLAIIIMEEPDPDGTVGFDIKIDYDSAPWLRVSQ